jgi:uncharacterized protein
VIIVVDTNVLESAALSPHGPAAAIFELASVSAVTLIVSPLILDEYRRALKYPNVQELHNMDDEDLDQFINAMARFISLVEPNVIEQVVVDDPDDDKFIAVAVMSGASHIVSGNRHLLSLGEHRDIQVLTRERSSSR